MLFVCVSVFLSLPYNSTVVLVFGALGGGVARHPHLLSETFSTYGRLRLSRDDIVGLILRRHRLSLEPSFIICGGCRSPQRDRARGWSAPSNRVAGRLELGKASGYWLGSRIGLGLALGVVPGG